jgi:hypothetical protein
MGKPELKQAAGLLSHVRLSWTPGETSSSEESVEMWSCLKCKAAFPDPRPEPALCAPCFETACADRRILRAGKVDQMLATAGVPLKFRNAAWKMPVFLEPFMKGHRGACLVGPEGVGKSAALALFIRERETRWSEHEGALEKDFPAVWRWLDWPAFVMDVQDAYGQSGEVSANKLLKAAAAAPLLVVDDIGAEKVTEAVGGWLYVLLDHREKWLLPTFLTTNVPIEGPGNIDERYSTRISGRIVGPCDVLKMSGKSRRLKP